jgi:hypothetical protein
MLRLVQLLTIDRAIRGDVALRAKFKRAHCFFTERAFCVAAGAVQRSAAPIDLVQLGNLQVRSIFVTVEARIASLLIAWIEKYYSKPSMVGRFVNDEREELKYG